ncbi:peptidylprolyl isomerase [Neogemmobacter tilapiae]|uniref:Peptidyl-prolyl cis-trans isomerase n=1 Tax=Neogemmobacter tilapiae TaxID=875041 RepID=A0A918WML4_9RHOB|nr:peptidylprolyl isomerase [Gemmobacter tilapiae]GHC60884.1 peptidyl-prolyl cis-trans isomerase [Gemmobacter tilapiae]
MAKTTEPQTDKRKRKASDVVIWVLMAMLVVGLGGFGITDFGGRISKIGDVGDRPIGTDDYANALQAEIRQVSSQFGQNLTMEQAQMFGIPQSVIQRLVVGAALDGEAGRLGLSAGDQAVAKEVALRPEFQGLNGAFDPAIYRQVLEQNRMNARDYEGQVRADLARTMLQGAVIGGVVAPKTMAEKLFTYRGEKRGLTLLRLAEADLTVPLAEPTEDELKAHYDANIAKFTKPEAKRITYAALLPEALAEGMAVDEASVKALYDDRIADYVQPERRLVERLVFPDQAAADAAKAKLDGGAKFEDLVTERGLTLDDIDLGDVSKADLGAAGDAIFALTENGQVAGPLMSDLGPALFRMNAILDAQEVSFDEAKADLTIEFQRDAARREIGARVEEIDDLLAGGATLEELAEEQKMELATIDFSTASDEAIAAYPAFRQAAGAVAEGDFPEAILLDDGGLVSLRLDEMVPAAPIPFDEAKEAVTESWRAEALAKALAARAAEMKTAVEGGTDMGSLGILSVTPEITRDGFVEGVPSDFMVTVFGMAEGELKVVEGAGFTGLVRLDKIIAADPASDQAKADLAALEAQLAQSLQNDLFGLYGAGLAQGAGIRLDDAAIAAVNANFP